MLDRLVCDGFSDSADEDSDADLADDLAGDLAGDLTPDPGIKKNAGVSPKPDEKPEQQ